MELTVKLQFPIEMLSWAMDGEEKEKEEEMKPKMCGVWHMSNAKDLSYYIEIRLD